MSYQVLARKWRPKQFKDVIGQGHITRTLINSIKNDKVAHAYLLTGTRGIGKTTIARIFAKAIRCEDLSVEGEPCLVCNSCVSVDDGNSLDFLEIDGASNNSVDSMRDLIENVQYLPSSGKYKVFVIDEVHMLTVSAFNALLKTLEEPPKHIIFIFATTDPQKLLGTVLSRCQRFDFKNSNTEELKNHLLEIAKSEDIQFEKDDLALELAKQGKGSVRDSLSLFDQVISLSSSKLITEDSLMMSLGMAKTKSVNLLVNAVLGRNRKEVLSIFKSVIDENIDLKIFSIQVLDKIYNLLTEIDEQGNINSSDLDETIIESLTLVEVYWVYETLSKDLEWAINSFDPEKTCCFSFIKSAIREKILTHDSSTLKFKKKTKLIEPIVEIEVTAEEAVIAPIEKIIVEEIIEQKDAPVVIEPEPIVQVVDEVKSWELFIRYVYSNHKAVGVNLERGNLLNSDDFLIEASHLKIAFTHECKIFYDFLGDTENRNELTSLLAGYLGIAEDQVKYSLEIINEEEKEKTNFQSAVEIEETAIQAGKDKQKNTILTNKYIKDAEELFNSKIEKVVLNDEE